MDNPLLAARRKYYQTLTISELVSECKARNVTVRRLRSQQDFIEAILKKDRELLSEERNSADKLDLRDNIKLLNGFLTDQKLSVADKRDNFFLGFMDMGDIIIESTDKITKTGTITRCLETHQTLWFSFAIFMLNEEPVFLKTQSGPKMFQSYVFLILNVVLNGGDKAREFVKTNYEGLAGVIINWLVDVGGSRHQGLVHGEALGALAILLQDSEEVRKTALDIGLCDKLINLLKFYHDDIRKDMIHSRILHLAFTYVDDKDPTTQDGLLSLELHILREVALKTTGSQLFTLCLTYFSSRVRQSEKMRSMILAEEEFLAAAYSIVCSNSIPDALQYKTALELVRNLGLPTKRDKCNWSKEFEVQVAAQEERIANFPSEAFYIRTNSAVAETVSDSDDEEDEDEDDRQTSKEASENSTKSTL